MAQPTPYTRQADFSDDELGNVGGRSTVRTAALDAELDALGLTANQTRVNLGLIQRDDGALRDGVVLAHTLGTDVRALIANAAFVSDIAYANMRAEAFMGDGVTTTFTLAGDPGNVANIDCSVAGLTYTAGSDYTYASNTLTFTAAPAIGDEIFVRYGEALPVGITSSAAVTYAPAFSGYMARTVEDELADRFSVKTFGAVGNNVADDTADIQSAISYVASIGGGTVYFPAGRYIYSAEIVVPPRVNLCGAGLAATVLVSASASARVRYERGSYDGRGGYSGDMTLDGNNIGTQLLKLGVVVERTFVSMDIMHSADGGLVIEGAQNNTFISVNPQSNFGSNLILDLGAGNNRFLSCEFSAGEDWGVLIQQSGASPSGAFSTPTANVFQGCIVERGGWTGSTFSPDGCLGLICQTAGKLNAFNQTPIAMGGPVSSPKSMVLVDKTGAEDNYGLTFTDTFWSGGTGALTALEVRHNCQVFVQGRQTFESFLNAFVVSDTGRILGVFYRTLGGVTNYFANYAGGTQPQQNLILAQFHGRHAFNVPAGFAAATYANTTTSFAGVEIYPNAVRIGDNAAAANIRLGKATRFSIDGLQVSNTLGGDTFVLQLGAVDLLVLNVAPTQASPNGSICLRTDTGAMYVREAGSWIAK